MAKFNQTYPTDLKYTEWQQIMEFFPSYATGRPPKWEKWQIINAILYVNRSGCQWRIVTDQFSSVANGALLLLALATR